MTAWKILMERGVHINEHSHNIRLFKIYSTTNCTGYITYKTGLDEVWSSHCLSVIINKTQYSTHMVFHYTDPITWGKNIMCIRYSIDYIV